MSMTFRTRSGEPPTAGDVGERIFDHWEPSGNSPYLTDGVKLYRYIGGVPHERGEIVALEDCESLKILLFDLDELRTLRLRSVIPADGEREEGAAAG